MDERHHGTLEQMPSISGSLQKGEVEITGFLSVVPSIKGVVREISDVDIYEGTYEVTPGLNDLSLETKGKFLKDDVTISQIPCERVENPSGGTTVVIGGY